MTSETYSLTPALPPHIPAIADLLREAYAQDILTHNLNAQIPASILHVRGVQAVTDPLKFSHLTGRRYLLAIENTTDQPVGVLSFNAPITLDAAQLTEKEKMMQAMKGKPSPEGANLELEAALGEQRAEIMKKYFDEKKDIFVNTLAVHPSHGRRGIASTLVQSVISTATEEFPKARIFLIATPAGFAVYQRAGLEVVEEIELDFDRYGGEGGVGKAWFMMWRAKV